MFCVEKKNKNSSSPYGLEREAVQFQSRRSWCSWCLLVLCTCVQAFPFSAFVSSFFISCSLISSFFLHYVLLFPPFLHYVLWLEVQVDDVTIVQVFNLARNRIIWKVIVKMWNYPLADLADEEDTVRLSEIKILINDPFEEFSSGEVFHYKDHLVRCEILYVWRVFNQMRASIINSNKNRNWFLDEQDV